MLDTRGDEEAEKSLQHAKQLEDAGDLVAARIAYQEIVGKSGGDAGSLHHPAGAWAAFRLVTWPHKVQDVQTPGRLLIDYARRVHDVEIIAAAAYAALVLGYPLNERRAEGTEGWLRAAEELGLRSCTQHGFQLAYLAFHALAMDGRPELTRARFYRKGARRLANRSRSVEAIELATMAHFAYAEALSDRRGTWAYRRALYATVRMALRMKNPEGLQTAAAAGFNLAIDYKRSRRYWRAKWTFAFTQGRGRASGMAYGLEQAAKASFNLAGCYPPGRRALGYYESAIELGRASTTGRALEYAAAAACNLAAYTVRRDRMRSQVLYEEAMSLGSASASGKALCYAAMAAEGLTRILDPERNAEHVADVLTRGIDAGEHSGMADGMACAERLRGMLQRLRDSSVEARAPAKGVVVIHGVGHPKKGTLLRNVVTPIEEWLAENVPVRGAFQRPETKTEVSADGRSFIVLRHGAECWMFTEAHWAAAIRSPPFGATVRWAAAHFVRYSLKLGRDAAVKGFIPTIRGVAEVTARTAYAVLQLPVAALIFPVMPVLTGALGAVSNTLYVRVMRRMPEARDMQEQHEAIKSALARWRTLSANVVGCTALIVGLAAIAALWYAEVLRSDDGWKAGIAAFYLALVVPLWLRGATRHVATEPWVAGGPISIVTKRIGMLSKHGILCARLSRQPFRRIYRDSLRDIATGPATAALNGLRRWLLANSEFALLRYAQWDNLGGGATSRLGKSLAMVGLIVFRLMNSLLAIAVYMLGTILMLPVAMLVWALSASGSAGSFSRTILRMKSALDSLILGSAGDIYLLMHDDTQAARIREELARSIAMLAARCGDVCVVAHSMGCAIAYETLADERNQVATKAVRTLVTVGGILPMVWRMPGLRPAFRQPLPSYIRWVNLWARLDPAEGGPLPPGRLAPAGVETEPARAEATSGLLRFLPAADPVAGTREEVVVSNEDEVFRDHTTYWRNGNEVVPCLVREIWGNGGSEAMGNFERTAALRAFRQRMRILCTSGPRMAAWYVLPVTSYIAWTGSVSILPGGAEETTTGRVLAAAVIGAAAAGVAHLAVWIARKTVADRFLCRLGLFSTAVPPPRPVDSITGDDKPAKVVAIGLATPLFGS